MFKKPALKTYFYAHPPSEEAYICCINAWGKSVPVYKRGHGPIALLILGQATLFRKPGLLPKQFNEHFTLYFADLFEKQPKKPTAYVFLTLNDFVDEIEKIRVALCLEKIALFGHSALGILATEYAKKYHSHTTLLILVSTAAVWGNHKGKLTRSFFEENATEARKKLFDEDQKKIASADTPTFILNYNARRAHFYYQPEKTCWAHIWDGIETDEALVNQYLKLIENYDMRKQHIHIPTFLALGLHDYSAAFYGWTDEAKSTLSNISYHIFDKSGHYPMVEEEDLFVKKIEAFIHTLNVSETMRARL